jgi:hypothetical protein
VTATVMTRSTSMSTSTSWSSSTASSPTAASKSYTPLCPAQHVDIIASMLLDSMLDNAHWLSLMVTMTRHRPVAVASRLCSYKHQLHAYGRSGGPATCQLCLGPAHVSMGPGTIASTSSWQLAASKAVRGTICNCL